MTGRLTVNRRLLNGIMPATELRICENCNKTVIGSCFCNYVFGTPLNYEFPSRADELLALHHALWLELHTKQDATSEWFADWIGRLPSIGCGCLQWLRDYLKDNPPVYGEGWYEWTVRLHDAVNTKLGKPLWDRIVAHCDLLPN